MPDSYTTFLYGSLTEESSDDGQFGILFVAYDEK